MQEHATAHGLLHKEYREGSFLFKDNQLCNYAAAALIPRQEKVPQLELKQS